MDFEATFPQRCYMNLERRPDRRAEAEAEFQKANLTVQRREAVDGKRLFARERYRRRAPEQEELEIPDDCDLLQLGMTWLKLLPGQGLLRQPASGWRLFAYIFFPLRGGEITTNGKREFLDRAGQVFATESQS